LSFGKVRNDGKAIWRVKVGEPFSRYTIADNDRHSPATHLDMVLMKLTWPDLPDNAALIPQFPARLRPHLMDNSNSSMMMRKRLVDCGSGSRLSLTQVYVDFCL